MKMCFVLASNPKGFDFELLQFCDILNVAFKIHSDYRAKGVRVFETSSCPYPVLFRSS